MATCQPRSCGWGMALITLNCDGRTPTRRLEQRGGCFLVGAAPERVLAMPAAFSTRAVAPGHPDRLGGENEFFAQSTA